ncbi:Protein kinase domain-containing protein [Aphelenchoides besseyi]|nr:Protein kinase domain-containing protein [Aphelenchoides besseyi]
MAEDPEEENGLGLRKGTLLASQKNQYVLDELIGEGGFGAVWRVYLYRDPTMRYAMKIEKKTTKRRHSKLKMEISILKLVLKERNKEKRHFTAIIDRGKKDMFFYLVMQLVGKSIEDLLFDSGAPAFSLATSLGIGIQSMEALEDLHKFGFVHRDVKPANYACGLDDKTHVIYLLDFGIARKYMADDSDSSMKTPRSTVNFKGTVRYASLSCHRNKEMGPKDDVESWFYMIVELMNPQGLPWRRLNDRSVVQRSKEDARTLNNTFYPTFICRDELQAILNYVDTLDYTDRPDYGYIYETLRLCAQIDNVNINDPFDWEKTQTSTADPK